ncbi:hypothetical protein [Caloramator sp. Dgby_cultured_2]|nr:hypothetical protein [Caloramator sp. Dgby_cultured_2]WDU83451.1 hypothetical protein PWK10_01840 [Caloramator sp. Dgby_cultured_2]
MDVVYNHVYDYKKATLKRYFQATTLDAINLEIFQMAVAVETMLHQKIKW